MSTAVAYHAPETFVGALLETNLRALMLMDAWSVCARSLYDGLGPARMDSAG